MTADELERAACKGKDTRRWYPLTLNGARAHQLSAREWKNAGAYALSVCDSCPVLEACRTDAIRNNDWHGIRGGMTPPELWAAGGIRRPGNPTERRHGTHSCYAAGCRRPECRDAHNTYLRHRRERAVEIGEARGVEPQETGSYDPQRERGRVAL